jgi:hypothetical protein
VHVNHNYVEVRNYIFQIFFFTFVSRNSVAVKFLHTKFKFFLEFLISDFDIFYDLNAPFNMGRFRLDMVCTKHVVYVKGYQRHPRFTETPTFYQIDLAMRNTADIPSQV